jgi:hypothetical protein
MRPTLNQQKPAQFTAELPDAEAATCGSNQGCVHVLMITVQAGHVMRTLTKCRRLGQAT